MIHNRERRFLIFGYVLPNCILIIGLWREKTCFWGFVNSKVADQPAHPRRMISAFVIHFLQSIISQPALCENPIVYLVSVDEETGLSLALLETLKTSFVAARSN